MKKTLAIFLILMVVSACTTGYPKIDKDFVINPDDKRGVILVGLAPGDPIYVNLVAGTTHPNYDVKWQDAKDSSKILNMVYPGTDKDDFSPKYFAFSVPQGDYTLESIETFLTNTKYITRYANKGLKIHVNMGMVLYIGEFYVEFIDKSPTIFKCKRNDIMARQYLSGFSNLPKNFDAINIVGFNDGSSSTTGVSVQTPSTDK